MLLVVPKSFLNFGSWLYPPICLALGAHFTVVLLCGLLSSVLSSLDCSLDLSLLLLLLSGFISDCYLSLDFSNLWPTSRPLLPLLSCMSREEFLELSAKVDQLADQVAILAQAVAQLSVAREPASPAASSYSALSSVPVAEASRSGASYSSSHDYNRLASLIPPCPESVIQLCSTLRGPWSFVDRAKRAWEIGYWARFCLEGRLEKPTAISTFGSSKHLLFGTTGRRI